MNSILKPAIALSLSLLAFACSSTPTIEDVRESRVTLRDSLKATLGHEYDRPVPPVSVQRLANGQKLFIEHCASCHGNDGKWNGPSTFVLKKKPTDMTDPEVVGLLSDRGRLEVIRHGILNSPMAGFEKALGKKGVEDVHAWTRSLLPKSR